MRQFLSASAPDKNGLLLLSGREYRYLRRVLRLRPGDMLDVRLSDGSLISMTVCKADERQRTITLQQCGNTLAAGDAAPSGTGQCAVRGASARTVQTEAPALELTLIQFAPHPSKMEQIIRQATECGVKHIIPVIGAYSERPGIEALKQSRQERLLRIIREARQQSGSPVDTVLHDGTDLKSALQFWDAARTAEPEACRAVFLWERSEDSRPVRTIVQDRPQKLALAVGCEGGISPAEAQLLKANGFIPIHFAGNILRCETAAVYGIAALQNAAAEAPLPDAKSSAAGE